MSSLHLQTCPLHLSHLFYLICIPLPRLLCRCHLTSATLVSDSSDIDNSVFEDLLNFCVYSPILRGPPFEYYRSQCAKGH